jgi:hypothetical protein
MAHFFSEEHAMPSRRSYAPSPLKRTRRTKAAVEAIDDALVQIVQERQPATCRHIFYCATTAGLVDKTERAYKGVICRRLKQLRRSRRIPWGWITDHTRWQIKPRSFPSLGAAVSEWQANYRHALWGNQNAYVEIWCEKDAVASILSRATSQFDVPLMVVRGFSSLSFLFDMSENLKVIGKPAYLYYLGDHDPSGLSISTCIERELRQFAPGVELHFSRLAVTPEQIEVFNLPTRPTKQSDTRAKNFVGQSVEVDAIDPRILERLVSEAITHHIDREALARTCAIEDAERETLQRITSHLEPAA